MKLLDWVPHIKKLGADAVYFCPVFESDAHGYDTRGLYEAGRPPWYERRFARVCAALHAGGHPGGAGRCVQPCGARLWAFRDVLEKREASPYRDWFHIDFGGDSGYNDGLWYEGWEGHYELVKVWQQGCSRCPLRLYSRLGGGIWRRRPAAGCGLLSGRGFRAPSARLYGGLEAGIRAHRRNAAAITSAW